MFKGVDVSHHNGIIDWRKVKQSGIDFAIIRAGYGWAEKQVDRQWVRNITEANRAGIDCGAYWFSYATNVDEARKEAKLFLKTIAPYKLTYPIAYDYEYDSVEYAEKRGIDITPRLACDMADAFMGECAKAKYYIVNYTNNDYLQRYFTDAKLKQYEVWLAKWTQYKPINVTGLWQNAVMPAGTVPGIKTEIDMDISYKDYPAIIRNAGLNRLTTVAEILQAETPVKPDTPPFKSGDIVKVKQPIIYGTSKRFLMFFREYEVISCKADRVVIGRGGRITAAIEAKHLEKIR